MNKPPRRDSAPTASEPADAHRQKRVERNLALVQRLSTGRTSEGFHMRATCASCGGEVQDWREHIQSTGSRAIYSKENGEFLARIEYDGACSACGGRVVEVRAEGRR
jgi:hypothetical protein